jgi:hypothetical protein
LIGLIGVNPAESGTAAGTAVVSCAWSLDAPALAHAYAASSSARTVAARDGVTR